MNPNEIDRREVVKALALGTAQLSPLLSLGTAAGAPNKTADWKPKFFSAPESELVSVIAELIIPRTETPGARDAKVHEYIDRALSEEAEDIQKSFREGLRWIDQRSMELYRKEFGSLDTGHQVALLSRISDSKSLHPQDTPGHEFFLEIRRRVVFGYYTSEIGLEQELTYKGGQVLDHWEGCPHPGHHGDAA